MNLISGYRNKPASKQYLLVSLFILAVSTFCFILPTWFGYKVVALLLLMAVSLAALLFDVGPVLLAALLSALIWDFFFIPPRFTFRISSTEDSLLLLMYFVIAVVHAVLTLRIRQMEKQEQEREEKSQTLKLYSTLLNSLSHELRTPIATIIGATDTLETSRDSLTQETQKELLNEISAASLRLNQQVENLLNMSRLESGFMALKKDWCDVNELVHSVINRLNETNVRQTVEASVQENIPLCKLDTGLIEQVLYNLVTNATQYTPAHAHILISASVISEQLHLKVEDNGPGFPPEEIPRVFDKFYRLKNSRAGGTGLGLSIVKGFTEAHKGTVLLKNLAGGGACFEVIIPVETSLVEVKYD